MKIEKQDEQRLVIALTIGERLWLILILAASISYYIFDPHPWLIALGVTLGLYALGELVGNKVVIDKPAESIMVEKRHFLLIHRQRVIPFSAVRSVVIDYEPKEEFNTAGAGGYRVRDAWKVSLDIGGKKLKIDYTKKKADMFDLARRISKFIGKQMIDNSEKPKSSFKGVGGTDFDFPSSRPPPYSL